MLLDFISGFSWPRAGQRDFFTTSISTFEEDGAVLRLLGEEWCGSVMSASDNYDSDDSNVTIRAKMELCGWKGYGKGKRERF